MAIGETARLIASLELDPRKFNAGVGSALGKLGKLETGLGRAGKGAGQLGAGVVRAGALIGAAAVGSVVAVTKAAADYEDAFAGVRKTVEATPEQLAQLSDEFRELSKNIPIAATEFARLGETAGALGIHVSAIDEFAEVTAKLGVTTNLTADEAADALGRIGNILNLTADDYDNFGSALVNLGNKGASTEAEIIEITKRFAATGKQAGLTASEILGLAEATASFTGLAPEAAGSSLSRLAGTLTKVAASGGAKFKLLNKIVGEDFRKALDKDASGALINFLKGLGKLDKYERANALKELGLDSVYLRQLLGGLTSNIDGVETSLANADAGWQGNFLNEEAAKRFDTLAQQFKILKNNIIDAGITIGTEFLPNLKSSVAKLIAALKVPGNVDTLKSIGQDIGKAIDSIKWGEVIQGARDFVDVMRGALGFARGIFDAINALPTEIKAAGLGLLGLNKLSGGLIGAGVGNIVSGLASAVGGAFIKAGIGKAFVQPVFVTNMGAGMGGAGAGAGAGVGLLGGVMTSAALLLILDGLSRLPTALTTATDAITAAFKGDVPTAVTSTQANITNAAPWLRGTLLAPLVGPIESWLADIAAKLEPPPPAQPPPSFHDSDERVATLVAALKAEGEANRQNLQPLPAQIAAKQEAKFNALRDRMEANRIATVTSQRAIVSSGNSDRNAIVTAIQRNRPVVRVTVNTRVSVNSITKAAKTQSAYGGGQIGSGALE